MTAYDVSNVMISQQVQFREQIRKKLLEMQKTDLYLRIFSTMLSREMVVKKIVNG